MSCSDRSSRMQLVIQVQISTTIPSFSQPDGQYLRRQYRHHKQSITGSEFNGVSFSCIKNSITTYCLMHLDIVENKSSISNQIQLQTQCSPSHTPRQTEAQETMNKLEQVPLQVYTTCTRYLCRGITFWTSFIRTIYLKKVPYFSGFYHHASFQNPNYFKSCTQTTWTKGTYFGPY